MKIQIKTNKKGVISFIGFVILLFLGVGLLVVITGAGLGGLASWKFNQVFESPLMIILLFFLVLFLITGGKKK